MLVLTRKINEAILIGDDIKVTLLNIESDRVRIGIDAPKSISTMVLTTSVIIAKKARMAASANVSLVDLSQLKAGAGKKEDAEAKAEGKTEKK